MPVAAPRITRRLQSVQTRQPLPLRRRQYLRQRDRAIRQRVLGDDPVDLRERLASDVDSPVHGKVLLAASAKLAGENFLRAPAHATGQISAVNSEFIAVPVDAVIHIDSITAP